MFSDVRKRVEIDVKRLLAFLLTKISSSDPELSLQALLERVGDWTAHTDEEREGEGESTWIASGPRLMWVAFFDTALYPRESIEGSGNGFVKDLIECVTGKVAPSSLAGYKQLWISTPQNYVATPKQSTRWKGFSSIIEIWRL
ncbi:hypothetical protein PIIN_06173 [Serendipita indica DSM 11827]|uniref:Uncharacterized protein n=1 Tax=Serendipita indica (strain DSM 11827) TaxID=1109443 RepID=G4TLP3_SERID|nr:hypothetical protein PIIN_06173 [Serendipita indica DSM 11827]